PSRRYEIAERATRGDRWIDGRFVGLVRAYGRLRISTYRPAWSKHAGRLGRHPRCAWLHAAIVFVPRSLCRAQGARRRTRVRIVDPGVRLSGRDGRAAASAVPGALRYGLTADTRARSADLHHCRHDPAQAHGVRD